MKPISLYLRLLRVEAWVCIYMFVLGIILSRSFLEPVWSLLTLFLMVFACLGFGFSINYISDVEEDRLSSWKSNPVATGEIGRREALLISISLAFAGIAMSTLFGPKTFVLYTFLVGLYAIYSLPPIRLKTRFMWDVLTHGFFAGVGLLVLPFIAYDAPITASHYGVFVAIFILSMLTELRNHIRDYEGDKAAGQRTTAVVLGKERTLKIFNALSWSYPVITFVLIPDKILYLVMLLIFLLDPKTPKKRLGFW